MKLISFSILFSFLIFASCSKKDSEDSTTSTVASSQPNILLIIADDMGLDASPGYNVATTKPSMPNLQAMMNTGVTFQNLWSAPTCTPTRATILTGKYGVKTKVLGVDDELSTSETSLQKYIDNNTAQAYSHAVIGKWHLSKSATHPTEMGVGYYAGLLSGSVTSYTKWNFTQNGSTTESNVYTTTKFTDLAIDWVGKQSKPWFLWLAFNAPHTPFHLPPTNLHSLGNLPSDDASINTNPLPYYMAALEAMDSEIGRFLNSLSDAERSNTIILFIGDNGTPGKVVQDPYISKKSKGTLYQGGINVPMVVSGKGVTRSGEQETALINTSDLFATIANLAGANVTDINNSKSFKGLLTDKNASKREYVYGEVDNTPASDGYTIRNNSYKLIKFNNGEERFYNLINDPYEKTNLLNKGLSTEETNAKTALESKANEIRN